MNSDKFNARFPTTQWNLVLVAGSGSSRESQDALATLCRTYWYPLYAFVRRQNYSPEEAQDLTQGFFAKLLEKQYLRDYQRERGRFRSFLLASLKHFLANARDRDRAKKRGGDVSTITFDEMFEFGERRFNNEPHSKLTPEKIFEKQWATTVLDKVLSRLGEQTDHFDKLSPYLIGDESRLPYAQLAIDLGTTEGALKVSIHRLRRRFREILREEISHTVSDPNEVQEEIRYLMAVVATPL